jgi:hypothetical protein
MDARDFYAVLLVVAEPGDTGSLMIITFPRISTSMFVLKKQSSASNG